MQTVSCPGCGAQVAFKSPASVMAVCAFCKSTVFKSADAVRGMGRMGDLLEDYSPIQIGTAGMFHGKGFTVIGRIQLKYPAGLWNEWHVLFDDGQPAWLGDFSGQYTITFEQHDAGGLPAFDRIAPAKTYTLFGQPYVAAEVRTARCTGGEGELPFAIGAGWEARLADFRHGKSFLTLDYADAAFTAAETRAYVGQAVTLPELQCQLLRDDDTVRAESGRIRTGVDRLACPSCGSSIAFVPGVTQQILCPSCRAEIDVSTRMAEVLALAERMESMQTTLALGATASIGGVTHDVIGLLVRADEEGATWTEYLLHNARGGLLWLVETDEGWYRSNALDDWPAWRPGQGEIRTGGRVFRKLADYQATVRFAAGAFNWRVAAGDTVRVSEYESGNSRLAAELGPDELTWSWSEHLPADQVTAWFGDAVKTAQPAAAAGGYRKLAKGFLIVLTLCHAIPLLTSFGRTWTVYLFAVLAIYLPALALGMLDKDSR
jgi:hypothetical protein